MIFIAYLRKYAAYLGCCLEVLINTIFERKIINIFLPISFNIFLGAQKNRLIETSFEYPHHMFWLRNKNITFLVHTFNLSPGYKHGLKAT